MMWPMSSWSSSWRPRWKPGRVHGRSMRRSRRPLGLARVQACGHLSVTMRFHSRSALIKAAVAATVFSAILVAPAVLFAWGEVGHRISGEAAALKMPPSTPVFFRNAVQQLGYLNPEPDRWRDRGESTFDPALN